MSLSDKNVVALIDELTVEHLQLWVAEGWVAPQMSEGGPVYDEIDVARLRFVCELKHDLNVNDDALPVILRLVDQVNGLRHTLRNLARAVEAQPKSVRERIAKALRDTSRL